MDHDEQLGEFLVEFLFSLTLKGAASAEHDFETPWGRRRAGRSLGGAFEGPRLKGEVVEGLANDWGAVSADRRFTGLDAQIVLRTDDGVAILSNFHGRRDEGGTIRISPLFEVDDGPYGWLNQIQAIGLGGPVGNDLRFDVYALK
jgi:hypothetical protein